MTTTADLFGVIRVKEPQEPESETEAHNLGSLPERVLSFFKDHKYQTFNMLELFPHFPEDHPTRLRRTLLKLCRMGKLRHTGEVRGRADLDVDRECITLNLHRPE